MFLANRLQLVCLYLLSRSTSHSLFLHDCDTAGPLDTWPIVAQDESEIIVNDCLDVTAIAADAASRRPALLYLRLHRNAISQIGTAWLENSQNIEIVLLNSNKLTLIPPFNCGAVGSIGCASLTDVRLQGNLITSVPARSFENHPKLKFVYLQSNRIATVSSLWIVDCPSVTQIWLQGNTNLTEFSVPEHAKLEILYLMNCNISSLDRDCFSLLPQLNDFRINGNPFKTLPIFVASHPVKIRVKSNGHYLCDCNAVKLAHNGMIVLADETRFCGGPDYNVGKNFSQLECRNGLEFVKESTEDMSYLLQQDNTNYLSLNRSHNLLLSTISDFEKTPIEVVGSNFECLRMQMSSTLGSNLLLVLPCRLVDSRKTSCVYSCDCGNKPCKSIYLDTFPISNAKIIYILMNL